MRELGSFLRVRWGERHRCWFMCVRTAIAPSYGGFTIGQIGGIPEPACGDRLIALSAIWLRARQSLSAAGGARLGVGRGRRPIAGGKRPPVSWEGHITA